MKRELFDVLVAAIRQLKDKEPKTAQDVEVLCFYEDALADLLARKRRRV